MKTWYTSKPRTIAQKSHINHAVCDSGWEAVAAHELDRNPNVESWVKNDHLGFEIHYVHNGRYQKYRTDFIIQLTNSVHLILEVKGDPYQLARSKQLAMDEWIKAVNNDGRFGEWVHAVSTHPQDVPFIIKSIIGGNRDMSNFSLFSVNP